MSKLEEIFQICVEKNFPFVAFQLPGVNHYQYLVQLSNPQRIGADEDITSLKGFVFAPFQQSELFPTYLIAADIQKDKLASDHLVLEQLQHTDALTPPIQSEQSILPVNKEEYQQNVTEIRNRILKGEFQKAILSRVILADRDDSQKLSEVFLTMCNRYHSSFISIVHIPGYATWIGATPELLFSRRDRKITLVSLAGTQSRLGGNVKDIQWEQKDVAEQKIVTDYLVDLLHDFEIKDFQKYGPETTPAGDIVHLKTVFTLPDASLNGHAGEFIKKLHPTPAVWGQPKNKALEIIPELERYQREYYAGYLGPVNLSGTVDLFVNLRTMKVAGNKFIIFVGCGITAESDPLKEWEETCMKADTLLSVINKK